MNRTVKLARNIIQQTLERNVKLEQRKSKKQYVAEAQRLNTNKQTVVHNISIYLINTVCLKKKKVEGGD